MSRRTGLSPDVLRAWERRYGAVRPTRSKGSHRLYTNEDVDRLLLLRRAIDAGRSIRQVAGLDTPALKRLVEEDTVVRHPGVTSTRVAKGAGRGEPPSESDPLAACLTAVGALDAAELESALGRAAVSLGASSLIDRVLIPLMQRIGLLWEQGSLRIVHEHVASTVVRTLLGNLTRGPFHPSAPVLVGATPIGQRHEFGVLTAMATAASCGWNATWIGDGLPACEIAAAALHRGAHAVALGLTFPAGDPNLASELRDLRRHLGETPILVGGSAAGSYEGALSEIGAHLMDGMADLRRTLRDLGAAPRPHPVKTRPGQFTDKGGSS